MKNFILILKQYTKSLVREGFLILLTFFIVLTLLDALSPLFYAMSLENTIKKSLPEDTAFFSPYDRMIQILMRPYGDDGKREELEMYLEEVDVESNAVGIGRTCVFNATSSHNPSQVIKFIGYNSDMIHYSNVPLMDGLWLSEYSSDEFFPIVIGGAFRDKFDIKVGDNITLDFELNNHEFTECKVVGILDKNDMYFELMPGGSKPDIYQLATIYQWAYNNVLPSTDAIVIFPFEKIKDNINLELFNYSSGKLLFFKGMEQGDIANSMARYNNYGRCTSIDDMITNRYIKTIDVNSDNIVTAITLFIFCVLGLGGYIILIFARNKRTMQIYRICGMSKLRGIAIQIYSLLFLIGVPSLIAFLMLPFRLPAYAILTGWVYLIFVLVLVFILIPPIFSIILVNSRLSFYIGKD